MIDKIEAKRIFNSIDRNLSDLEDVLIVRGKLKLRPTGDTKLIGGIEYTEVETPTGKKLFINSKNVK